MAVQIFNGAEFQEKVAAGGALLVDFYADWCGPCKMMAPVLDKVAAAFEDRVTVAKINVDEEQELAVTYGIQSIPALLLFKDGEVAKELIGLRPYEDIAAHLEANL